VSSLRGEPAQAVSSTATAMRLAAERTRAIIEA
jgi:hypothetical protein